MKQLIHWIKQPSISKPLIAAFLAVLVLPVGILAYFSYQTAGNSLESELTHSAQGNVSELNSVLENMLEGKLKAIDYYSESITKEKLETKNKSVLLDKMKQYVTVNDDVASIYAASRDKAFVKYPSVDMPSDYNPLTREWYTKAVEKADSQCLPSLIKTPQPDRRSLRLPSRQKTDQALWRLILIWATF
ncbi:hypothetical protein KQR56_05720 [Bacillus velezensis]|nr:hypothetical protein [Bacillus velezensis]